MFALNKALLLGTRGVGWIPVGAILRAVVIYRGGEEKVGEMWPGSRWVFRFPQAVKMMVKSRDRR